MNVGVFVTLAVLLDLVLWLLVLLGSESVIVPADFAVTHQADFDFPYSHGLVAALAWSALAGTVAALLVDGRRRRIGALAAAAVFSHWLLDALVHEPELPLAGSGSPTVGLALWNQISAALGVEAVIVAVGLWLFLPHCGLPRRRAIALGALTVVVLAFTIAGMTIAPPPPSAAAMAASSWGTLVVVCALMLWLGRATRGHAARVEPGSTL